MLNLALNKPALQSSTSVWSSSSNPEADARGANNGQISRHYGFHTAYESNPWWQVDLQHEFLIRKVVLYNRQEYAQRLRYFSILISLDGEKWEVIYRKRNKSVFGLTDELPYVAEISQDHLARYVRVRLDGLESLHFSECQVFGKAVGAEARQRLIEEAARAEQGRLELPPGRNGKLIEIDDFMVFVDHDNYAPEIIATLESGWYESRERWLAKEILEPDDRVIEAGTAVGLVAMTAALIVGAANVLTFDANPEIVADAQCNFKRNGLGEIKSRWGVLKNRRSVHRGENETVDFYISKHFWASRLQASEHDESILKMVQVPVFCLEDEIEVHGANVLICDIEGGEVELLMESDLRSIRKIIIETHYGWVGEQETDEMMRKLISDGFSIHLGLSGQQVITLRR
jgi:FkbM family methyltransferase